MDHYQTLNVSPNASFEEIRTAFRKLAMQYHPDKNTSPEAVMRFRQVQQAWEVLKDRKSREAYNYRRYRQQPQQASRPLAQTVDDLLRETSALLRKTKEMDPFRTDYDTVLFALKDALSDHNRRLFLAGDNQAVKAQVFNNILLSMYALPFSQTRSLVPQLAELAAADPRLQQLLHNWQKQARWQYYWNRYKIWCALLLAILFCVWLVINARP